MHSGQGPGSSLLRFGVIAALVAGCSAAPGAGGERTSKESEALSLTLVNGWTNAPYATRGAAVYLDPSTGIVRFSGAVSGGTASTLFTLPVGYRPAVNTYVPVDLFGAQNGRLIIEPSGAVLVQAQGDGTDPVPAYASGFVSLEGASFAPGSAGFSAIALQDGWVPYSSGYTPQVGLFGGVVHFKGAISSGSGSLAFTLPAAYRPSTDVYLDIDLCTANKGRLHVTPSGAAYVQAETSWSNATCFTSLDGAWFVPAPSSGTFSTLTLQNGWQNAPYSTTSAVAEIVNGVVHFKGAIASGSSSGVFTLPPQFWPSSDVYVPVDLCNAHKGRLHVVPTGAVDVETEGPLSDATCFTSLEGASYSIAGFQPAPFPIAFPQMPTGGGSILPKLQLASIAFTGETQGNGESNTTFADTFGRFIVQSSWLQTITAPYRSSSPYPASYLATYTLSPNQGSAYQNGIINPQQLLQQAVSSSAITLPSDTTGLVYQIVSSNCSMSSQHGGAVVNGVNVGWIIDCGNGGNLPYAVGASHEVAEEITDPNQGYSFGNEQTYSAWQNVGEIGDACEGTSGITETSPTYGTFYVASAWSNTAALTPGISPCVPSNPWYANVSPSGPLPWNQWNTMPINVLTGNAVTVTLTAWANGTPPNGVSTWTLTAVNSFAPTTPLPATLSNPTNPSQQVAPLTGVTIQAGQSTTLTFDAPSTTGAYWVNVTSSWKDTQGHVQTSYWPLLFSVIQ